MRNNDLSPTVLHYIISEVGKDWVLSCESVPIARFASVAAAKRAAASYVSAAKGRGDCALVVVKIAGAAAA